MPPEAVAPDLASAWRTPYAVTAHDLWTLTNVGEVFPSAVTPLTWSLMVMMGEAIYVEDPERLAMIPKGLFRDGRPPSVFRAINGRMYYNTGLVHYLYTDVFGFPSWFWMLSLGGPQNPAGDAFGRTSFRPLRMIRRLPRVLRETRRQRRRLAARGLVEHDDDVFFLTLDELRAAAESAERGRAAPGLPAVVNTRTAASTIRTGQIVTVDGTAGTVTWRERPLPESAYA